MVQELSTKDELEYQFYPVTTGSLHFKVKATNDAHVTLTTGPAETYPMIEVFIGGWSNSRSVIRRNRTKPDKAKAETPDILNGETFRGFWIRWQTGVVEVGKEGESSPFLAWEDPEPFGIGHYGICTGWGASGSWMIEDGTEIRTANNLEYIYKPITRGSLKVDVCSPSNAHISLTTASYETEPMYEFILGGWENTASVIRYNREKPFKVREDTPDLLSNDEFRSFVIQWNNGHITVKKDGTLLLEWQDPTPIGVSHFGVRTAWGAQGQWRVKVVDPRHALPATPGWNPPFAPTAGGSPTWVDARGGEIPPFAVPGGFDNEQLYIGRASHEREVIPGKVVPSHGVCYIPWGGTVIAKEEYQVLCGCRATWVPCKGGQVPEGALQSGETEEDELLYVGRAEHDGMMTLGKVHCSHSFCYIPYKDQEVGKAEYEVLVPK